MSKYTVGQQLVLHFHNGFEGPFVIKRIIQVGNQEPCYEVKKKHSFLFQIIWRLTEHDIERMLVKELA